VRFVVCHTCKHVVQVGGDPEEVATLLGSKDSYPCITPLCRGRMQGIAMTKAPQGYVVEEVPVRGFFRAIHGFGPGTGDPASLKRLKELLLTQRVVDLSAESVGQPERVILRELVLENGTRLHFETSARGACVYYIEEPGPSCMEVVENELAAAAASESCNTNREEVGRAPQAESLGSESPQRNPNQSRASELSESECVSSVSETGGVPAGSNAGCAQPGADPNVRV